MSWLLYPAPVFLLIEFLHLVVAERYLGIKRIEQGVDPRRLPLSTWKALGWSFSLLAIWLWMPLLLLEREGRAAGVCMLLVSVAGFVLRRSAPLRWILVILTFEGALRIGFQFYLCIRIYRTL